MLPLKLSIFLKLLKFLRDKKKNIKIINKNVKIEM